MRVEELDAYGWLLLDDTGLAELDPVQTRPQFGQPLLGPEFYDRVHDLFDVQLVGLEDLVDILVVAPVQERVVLRLQEVSVLVYEYGELEIILIL